MYVRSGAGGAPLALRRLGMVTLPKESRRAKAYAVALLTMGLAPAVAGWGRPQAKAESPKPCIVIRKTVPLVVQADDSGNTTEPIRMTIEAQGPAEDLKGGEIVYSEDDVQKTAIPIGDLHAGVQTVTIPSGLHMTSSSELFSISLVRPDGSETPDDNWLLNGENSVAPAKPKPAAKPASDDREDSDQPIATIQPGVDRDEAESIRQFNAGEVGITSEDGFIRHTSGDDSKGPAQTITLQGTNFKDGMLVKLTTTKGGQTVEVTSPLTHTQTIATLAKPSGYVPNNPSELMRAVVVVPVKITHGVESAFSVKTARAESSDTCE
jgi:hypothetical protein